MSKNQQPQQNKENENEDDFPFSDNVRDAMELVDFIDDDLPDGAYWAMVDEFSDGELY